MLDEGEEVEIPLGDIGRPLIVEGAALHAAADAIMEDLPWADLDCRVDLAGTCPRFIAPSVGDDLDRRETAERIDRLLGVGELNRAIAIADFEISGGADGLRRDIEARFAVDLDRDRREL